jgi:hypothetical protein
MYCPKSALFVRDLYNYIDLSTLFFFFTSAKNLCKFPLFFNQFYAYVYRGITRKAIFFVKSMKNILFDWGCFYG